MFVGSLNVFDTDNMTPGLRRRRERAERQKSQVREQLLLNGHNQPDLNGEDGGFKAENHGSISPIAPLGTKRDIHNLVNNSSANSSPEINSRTSRPWMLTTCPSKDVASVNSDNENQVITLKRENTVKDLTQKLASQNGNATASAGEPGSRIGDLSGIISKAKEGLAKSKSKVDIKPTAPNGDASTSPSVSNGNHEQKKSDNELHWDFLVSNLNRALEICDLDFTELKTDDDVDIISPHQLCNISMQNNQSNGLANGHASPTGACSPGGPPPPPPGLGKIIGGPPAAPPVAPPPLFNIALKHQAPPNSIQAAVNKHNSNKTKKTVKLFWKEVREDPMTAMKIEEIGSIWNELQPIPLDTAKLEHLFESRAKDMMNKVFPS